MSFRYYVISMQGTNVLGTNDKKVVAKLIEEGESMIIDSHTEEVLTAWGGMPILVAEYEI